MPLTAIALLRISTAPNVPSAQVTALDDGFLLDTGAPFATDPDELSELVHEQLGAELAAQHWDDRGVFFLPSVAAPSARSYEGVIAEVADGGVWGPAPSAGLPLGAALGGGALGALLGNLMRQMPSGVLEQVGAAARGQPGAFEQATSQLRAAVSSSGELQEMAGKLDLNQLGSMLQGSGIDMNAMQQLVGEVQTALAKDPAATAALAEKLFGARVADDEDDESDGS
ncbi:MAG TPA: hypothetical protein VJR89_34855 [Polyangiales bacterium]|nr:hypothetical protein [Polyangiales bacterium]